MLRIDCKDVTAMRLGLGLSCAELGKLSYISRQNIWNIEVGKVKSKATLYLLQLILDSMYKDMPEDERKIRQAMGKAGIRVKTEQQVIDFKKTLNMYKEAL